MLIISLLASCNVEMLGPKTPLQLKYKVRLLQRDHPDVEHGKYLPHLQGEPGVWWWCMIDYHDKERRSCIQLTSDLHSIILNIVPRN